MAVTFRNRPDLAAKAGAAPTPVVEKTRIQTKKEQRAQERLERRDEFYRQREIANKELQEELGGRNIPETIEEGIRTGRVSAQELIEIYEEETGHKAGPRMRRYIVANTLAKNIAEARMPGSQNYTPEIGDLILERLIAGESLVAICRDKYMPTTSKFLHWVTQNPELREGYTLAMQIRAEAMAHELLPLADQVRIGVDILQKADGSVDIKTGDMINRTRIQIDTRKFLLSKILPKVYGTVKEPSAADRANGLADASDSEASGQYFTVTGGLPDEPLGVYKTEDEKDDAIARARLPRRIEKGNPVPVEAVETDYSDFGAGLAQEKFTDSTPQAEQPAESQQEDQ